MPQKMASSGKRGVEGEDGLRRGASSRVRTLHAATVSLFCFIVHCDVSKYALRSPSGVTKGGKGT